jgi:hypothetical protein
VSRDALPGVVKVLDFPVPHEPERRGGDLPADVLATKLRPQEGCHAAQPRCRPGRNGPQAPGSGLKYLQQATQDAYRGGEILGIGRILYRGPRGLREGVALADKGGSRFCQGDGVLPAGV